MDLTKRQNEILNLLIEQNTVHSSDLSEKYSVSTETIRKDLNVLDALGYAKKHHGYATISPQYLKEYLNIDSKKGLNNQEKIAIAQRALSFVPDNSVIYCDSGTTVCELVRLLVARSSVTIVTPSLAIVEIMKSLPDKNHHLFLLGGYVNYDSALTRQMEFDNSIEQFRFAAAFLGTTGVRYYDGPTSSKYNEGLLRQRAMARSASNIVLCDHTKFLSGGVHQYATWKDCTYLITDSIPDQSMRESLEKQIEVIYC
ncbi:DeoR/GlpR family DNA-binding transcription regulator [Lachnospiraceae bacterium 64-25]|nr:glucitol operon repressor [Lachnospiraceae bacterium]